MITLGSTCGEKKIHSTIKNFSNIMGIIVANLIQVGEKPFDTFRNEQLSAGETELNKPIKKNSFLIPENFEYQRAEEKKNSYIQLTLLRN